MPIKQGNHSPKGFPLLFALLSMLLSTAALAQDLSGQIESLLSGSPIRLASLGMQIVDTQSHHILAELNADQPAIPASNMKLLTSVAALHILGSDFTFRTELRRIESH